MTKKDKLISLLTIIIASICLGICLERTFNRPITCEYITELGDYYACFVKVEK